MLSESENLKKLQQGSEEALELLMHNNYVALYNYASKFSNDKELIKDCIQEVFISFWQRRETATSIVSLKYYFLRAVKNRVLKSLQHSYHIISKLPDEYEFSLEFSAEQKIIEKQVSQENTAKVITVLSRLTNRQKEIIYLKFYGQLDHRQIADLMNISHQSVYNLLHESIQKLRHIWKAEFIMTVAGFYLPLTFCLF